MAYLPQTTKVPLMDIGIFLVLILFEALFCNFLVPV